MPKYTLTLELRDGYSAPSGNVPPVVAYRVTGADGELISPFYNVPITSTVRDALEQAAKLATDVVYSQEEPPGLTDEQLRKFRQFRANRPGAVTATAKLIATTPVNDATVRPEPGGETRIVRVPLSASTEPDNVREMVNAAIMASPWDAVKVNAALSAMDDAGMVADIAEGIRVAVRLRRAASRGFDGLSVYAHVQFAFA